MESPIVNDTKNELSTLIKIQESKQTLKKMNSKIDQAPPLDELLIESQA